MSPGYRYHIFSVNYLCSNTHVYTDANHFKIQCTHKKRINFSCKISQCRKSYLLPSVVSIPRNHLFINNSDRFVDANNRIPNDRISFKEACSKYWYPNLYILDCKILMIVFLVYIENALNPVMANLSAADLNRYGCIFNEQPFSIYRRRADGRTNGWIYLEKI